MKKSLSVFLVLAMLTTAFSGLSAQAVSAAKSSVDLTPIVKEASEVMPTISDEEKTPVSTGTAEIMQVKDNRRAIVTINSDDGSVLNNEWMNEKYKEYGLKGTIMLIGDFGARNPAGFRAVTEDGHTDIASHSQTHTYLYADQTFTDDVYKKEIIDSASNLKTMFPKQDIIAYAPAGNVMTSRGLAFVKAAYYAMRSGIRGYNPLDPSESDWYNLKMMEIPDPEMDNEQRKAIIDETIQGGKWLIEMWHGLDEGSYHPMSEENAEIHYQYLSEKQASGEIWVASFNEAVKYIRERQISKAAYKVYDDCVKVAAAYDVTALPKEIFDEPLSVKTYIPYTTSEVLIRQGESCQIKTVETDEKGSYVYADVVPNMDAAVITAHSADTDTRLASLTYGDNQTVNGFQPDKFGGDYQVILPSSVSAVTVRAEANAAGAAVTMEPADGVLSFHGNDAAKITVTARDGITKSVYTVNFRDIPAGYEPISTAEEFVTKLAADPSGKFWLTQDITLGTQEDPISTPIAEFKGELIGADETNPTGITMYINDTKNTNVGLFGQLSGDVVIKNLCLKGCVKGSGLNEARNVGALAGACALDYKAEISNCVNEAEVSLKDTTAWGRYVSGFIANIYQFQGNAGKLDKLVNKGKIDGTTASDACGGIAAIVGNVDLIFKIINCENYGEIAGKGNQGNGGIVGWTYVGTAENCYNAGKITGSPAGGIAGNAMGTTVRIIDCCNIGSAANSIGNDKAMVKGCYYLGEDQGITGALGKTAEELRELLADRASAAFKAALSALIAEYEPISTAEEFVMKLTANPSGKFLLTQDITLGTQEEPISTPIAEFKGELIGADETNPTGITMYINDTKNTNVGLFGQLSGDVVIKNLRLKGCVKGTGLNEARNVGALAGAVALSEESEIRNCVNEAEISLKDTTAWGRYVSGFIANIFQFQGNAGKLDKLVNKGKIDGSTASDACGGISAIIGNGADKLKITNCENYGEIAGKGNNGNGGIVGWAYTSTLQNCCNAGKIAGSPSGGIVGVDVGASFKISNSCNIGSAANPIGMGKATVNDCYYLGEDQGITGAQGKTAKELKELLADSASEEFKAALNALITYTVTVSEPEHGTLTPSGRFSAAGESKFSVTAAPASGYRIKSVQANGIPLAGNAENIYTAVIHTDTVITAEFEEVSGVIPTIVSPKDGVFVLPAEEGCGSITFGMVTDMGYTIEDYGIVYSQTETRPTIETGITLSAKGKALVGGAFGVKIIFQPVLKKGETYYTRPYVTYVNGDNRKITIYDETVLPAVN